ncbi:MAG TPA: hypothetical protein VGR71_04745, partial [Nitrospira sp.]|nr:hypothetical protein [Nitrospira sp.]
MFLAFLPVIGGAAIVYSILKSPDVLGESPSKSLLSVVGPSSVVATVLGGAAFSRWLVNAGDGATPFSDWTWWASILQLRLSSLLDPFLPRLVLFFLAAWAVRIVLSTVWTDVLGAYSRVAGAFSVGAGGKNLVIGTRSTTVALILCLGLAALVGAYIYAPAINPTSVLVGVDVKQFYYGAAQTMFGTSPAGALSYALSNDRTAYLLFQYVISEATGSPDLAIRMMPALLSVLLVVSTFWFTRVATGDDLLSSTAALFASTSFQVTAGIDGGLYANWLAMVETFSFFGALLLGLRRKSSRNLTASAGFSVLLLFTHPWTWFAVMGVVVIYVVSLVMTSRLGRDVGHLRDELVFLGAVLLINLGAEALKRFLPTGTGVEAVYGYTLSGLSPSNIVLVVGALESTLTSYLAGALSNPGIVVLGIVGVLTLRNLRSSSSRLLLCWLAAASGGAILTGDSAEFLQSRLLYIIPFQVFAAIGFVAILRFAI